MTPAAIELVRQSWRAVDTAALVERFYAELFAAEPAIESLFIGDRATLRRKFDETLSAIVEHLDAPSEVGARVLALGARHAAYGVLPRHYALVEEALIAAFRAAPDTPFDSATERAWREAFRALAEGMLDGGFDGESPLGR